MAEGEKGRTPSFSALEPKPIPSPAPRYFFQKSSCAFKRSSCGSFCVLCPSANYVLTDVVCMIFGALHCLCAHVCVGDWVV